jgi:hypothetical protein
MTTINLSGMDAGPIPQGPTAIAGLARTKCLERDDTTMQNNSFQQID